MEFSSDDNRQRQQDEIMALQAIFGDSSVELDQTAGHSSYLLHVPLDCIEAQADIRFHLPATYPSDDPPIFEWIGAIDLRAKHGEQTPGYIYPMRQLALSASIHSNIEQELHRMWDEDMCRDVVVFSWVAWLDGYLSEHWPQPLDPIALPKEAEPKSTSNTGTPDAQAVNGIDFSKPLVASSHVVISGSSVPEIYTGAALEMKKSVFVAHVARVKSAEDVQNVHDALLQDRKIAQATHNILAYRIQLENGSISQDNDDDGETAAGKRLGHLLQLLEVVNVMVVVTRWYGGTHLGPDRFKLINNAARQALETGGFISNQPKTPATQSKQRASNSR
ncbi:ribosomal protein S5 domain 2-type protein [Kickxella alabastrina]|uniref:ribosomal protein S5 domain 2-type protein n=1 Tax=Kickxella alabastrina TaxID=61397 RepID=UPI002221220B|nr:ribosomal protein S5 domain 2-type protein [Kickxella alabastrina]KAI7825844.1 ribosomal protein S5 domain 2-type protein [Kickxella alabastrina]KAJ1944373.1 hypothetical protein GGF37_002225 [Kickxella alabastrina]